ncbi:hypothetical protein Glove_202g91 [Diversispora epigaea]|uniref:Uncharacterized protein n=1 Tax=Diversispora epigaea TaxID=1348612 RepID=A0A397IU74_9GLOM|nr:hypothetical protein Glove_202g91 [Diversispora epigaea]
MNLNRTGTRTSCLDSVQTERLGALSLRYEVRPRILSIEKINNQKKIIVGHDALKKYANLVLQKYSDYIGSWDIEEKDSQWYVYFNRKIYLECLICKRTHDKDQR